MVVIKSIRFRERLINWLLINKTSKERKLTNEALVVLRG